jgi:L-aspartate oxidase
MWNYTGIVRTKKRLLRANADLSYLAHRIEKFYKESTLTKELIELRNGIIASLVVVRAALKNEESIGCHFRKD